MVDDTAFIHPTDTDEHFMRVALSFADKAETLGEVPVGAVVVHNGNIVGQGYNQPISGCDPTAHAEIVALRDAANQLSNYRLPEVALYVTLEPCSMCAGAIAHARVSRLIYAAAEPKAGVVSSQARFFEQSFLNHKVQVTSGILASESSKKLSNFFARRRREKLMKSNTKAV